MIRLLIAFYANNKLLSNNKINSPPRSPSLENRGGEFWEMGGVNFIHKLYGYTLVYESELVYVYNNFNHASPLYA